MIPFSGTARYTGHPDFDRKEKTIGRRLAVDKNFSQMKKRVKDHEKNPLLSFFGF